MTDHRILPLKEGLAYARPDDGFVRVALHGYEYNDYRGLLTPAQALALAEMLIRSAREISDRKAAP
jgi:hypothetical protein